MAYEKQTWRCGDTITNTGLNHIEDGIEANDTAIANLQTQINNIDIGYSCTESRQTVFDGEYTTVKEEGDSSAYYEDITLQTSTVPSTLIVTFNGTEYSCPNHDNEFGAPYLESSDGFDWSSYPFNIYFTSFGTAGLLTENAGTYSVKAEMMVETISTSECFAKAVKSFVGYECSDVETSESILSEAVTTAVSSGSVAVGRFSQRMTLPNKIVVEFTPDGGVVQRYTCARKEVASDTASYGATVSSSSMAVDFTNYPFALVITNGDEISVATETAGTYNFEIYEVGVNATTTECFENAVKSVVGSSIAVVHITGNDNDGFESDLSCSEMQKVIDGGGYLVAEYNGDYYPLQTALDSSKKATKGLRAMFVFSRTIVGTSSVTADEFRFMENSCDIGHTTVVFSK